MHLEKTFFLNKLKRRLMEKNIQDFLDKVSKRNQNEPEFLQAVHEVLYEELVEQGLITHQYPGDTIGNTLHNYSVLADRKSVV